MTRTGNTEGTWRKVDAAWYLSTYPLAETLLAETQADDPASVYRAIGSVFLHSPNPAFDECWYRARYPAVREAIRDGTVESGFAHYRLIGRTSLSPHWLFDPDYYRMSFENRYNNTLPPDADADPYGHFLETGQHEGLSGHFLFDPAIYTATAPYELARRIDREGPFSTCLLQMHAGDDPTTSPVFDPGWYRARYPAAAAGIAQKTWLCALHHYLTNNDPSAFDPGPGFCDKSYRAWHFDVTEAIRRGEYRNGFEHYMRIGRRERRFFTQGQPPPSGPVVARFPLRSDVFENLVLGPGDAAKVGAPPVVPDTDQTAAEQPFRAGTFVYGGTLFTDLQKCLTNSLSRLWLLRDRPDVPALWHADDPRLLQGTWPSWLGALWQLLGLGRHPGLFITEPTRFQRVIVPEPGLMEDCAIHPRQARALGVHAATTQPTQSCIWLSRPGNDPTESEVEAVLAARGWEIVTPETMPLSRHLDLFTEAAVLAGASARLFLPVLLAEKPIAALIPVLRPGAPVPLLQAVAQAKQVCQMFVIPKLRAVVDTPGEMGLADPSGLADTICKAADEAIRERRLGRLEG